MFSLVMPTCNDFHGVAFTLKAAQLYHSEYIDDYVVVDNCENGSVHSQPTKGITESIGGKYIPFASCKGTACAKNEAIRNAKNDWVICLDSHVMLYPNAVKHLFNQVKVFPYHYGKQDDVNKVLFHGPIMQDSGQVMATHFDPVWRGEMYGVWGLDKQAYDQGKPFEISGMGMGCFAVNKRFWPGFHKDFKGFGGEEMYIHEKYRQLGGKVVCLPQFRWWHRFARPGDKGYHHTIDEKVYNYVVGWRDLGLDLSPIYDNFIARGLISESRWLEILNGWKPPIEGTSVACCGEKAKPTYEQLVASASDINEHLPTLMQLAKDCKVVVDCGARDDTVISFQAVSDITVHALRGNEASLIQPVIENDLLFLDTDPHTADHVYKELDRWFASCKRYIVLHDTEIYGEKCGSEPGILPAIRRFQSEHPEWVTIRHYQNNNGLTVLSCQAADYPPNLPPLFRRAKNFLASTTKHIANGGKLALPTVQEQRLAICKSNGGACPANMRIIDKNACSVCGCPLDEKVKRPLDVCPLGYWQETEEVE